MTSTPTALAETSHLTVGYAGRGLSRTLAHEIPCGCQTCTPDTKDGFGAWGRPQGNCTIQTKDGHRLANFIAMHSGTIANQFPAADDLLKLIIEEAVYISRRVEKRVGTTPPRAEARHNSTVI